LTRGASSCRTAVVILMALSAVSAAGCSHAAVPADRPTVSPSAGPWSDEFAQSLEGASPYERAILADGVVTPAELAEAQSKKRACLRAAGYRWDIEEDGTSSLEPLTAGAAPSTDVMTRAYQTCSRRFDRSVTYLFDEVRRNPERRDEAEIMVACLRKEGLVDSNYSERQWRLDDDAGRYPFGDQDPRFVQCRLDPLDLVEQR
jgi:hypothetical protein